MASIQDKIANATKKVKRKLWDNEVKNKGTEVHGVHLRITEDKYGDAQNTEIIVQEFITAYFYFPDRIPLTRYRATSDPATLPVDQTNMFFFEILPITVQTKWGDHVEVGDFLIYTMMDEEDNELEMIFQVVDELGAPEKYLTWKQSLASPYTGNMTSIIRTAIANYEE